jgi:hypothetical protein
MRWMATIETGPRSQLARVLGIDCVWQLPCGFLCLYCGNSFLWYYEEYCNAWWSRFKQQQRHIYVHRLKVCMKTFRHAAVMPEINTKINQSIMHFKASPKYVYLLLKRSVCLQHAACPAPPPYNPPNATFRCTSGWVAVNQSCQATCSPGLTGAPVSVCQSNGLWSSVSGNACGEHHQDSNPNRNYMHVK